MLKASMEQGHLERKGARALADAAMVSRSAWYRRQAAEGLDRPMSAHRRLLLERAAYRLARTAESVSELGLSAGFANTSAFTRAFRRSYGLAPSAYRRCAPTDWRIPPFGGIHYAPSDSPLSPRQGTLEMKLIELWLSDHAVAAARLVSVVDAHPGIAGEVAKTRQPFFWLPPTMTVADLANGVCAFAEPWIHLLDGEPATHNDGTRASRLVQIEANRARLQSLISRFEAEGSWDMTFVDHECEPPQTFSYGGVVLMIMTFTNHLRVELELELRERELLGKSVTLA